MRSTLRAAIPAYAVPVLVFLILISLTTLVWRQQAHYQRSQVKRHTVDVTMQAARRLEIHVKSRLTVASIFAHHWETHDGKPFSKSAFHDFASVLKRNIPGYHAIRLVPPSGDIGWSVPVAATPVFSPRDPAHRAVLQQARHHNRLELSPPLALGGKRRAFFAALPIRRGAQLLGWLVVEFRIRSLLESCFLSRIRGEFRFRVTDGAEVVYRHPSDARSFRINGSPVASRSFQLQNRRWQLNMTPSAETSGASSWFVKLWVFGFGLLLSLGIALSIAALAHRMRMYRGAHDQALRELDERHRAEARQAQLARQALMAQEEERARVSRDLHDELGQILTAMRLELDLTRKRPSAATAELDYTTELLEKATEELRRVCRGLRPPLLDDLGVVPAIRQLVEEFEEHAGVAVSLETDISDEEWEMSSEVALCVYRILQEALTNVRRHAKARAVAISLLLQPDALTLEITDDGDGFKPSKVRQQASGLIGMQERASLVGGTLEVSSVLGEGTRIEARMPRPQAETEKNT